ncbi:MAG: glutamate--cysteine ligase [Planctomycetota bacterium]|nr:glutamate--cysteine ligase [Planctomycetota bacterium]
MISQDVFRRNDWPTLGVEVELQLVDSRSMALKSAIGEVLEGLHPALRDSVKPEFMQCYVEINTDVCRTVADVGSDLGRKIRSVEQSAARNGVELCWAATHPFSHWQDQEITPNERYYKLANLLGETIIRPVTFGLHVHVGVQSGDQAIRVIGQLQKYLPALLALSANSPFWHGRMTGHHSHRVEVLEGFPTGGLPPQMQSWEEYCGLINQLRTAGFIESHRELWWDVRPNTENGTVEVRICDMPPDLPGVLGLTALIQCLVQQLSQAPDGDLRVPDCHPILHRQNRWRASRFGLAADLVDPATLEPQPARSIIEQMVCQLAPIASELGCERDLEFVLEMIARLTGSERQIALYEQTGDLAEVVRTLVRQSRLDGEGHPMTPRLADLALFRSPSPCGIPAA